MPLPAFIYKAFRASKKVAHEKRLKNNFFTAVEQLILHQNFHRRHTEK